MDRIYVNDYGMILNVETNTDLTTTSIVKLLVRKPDLTQVEWVGVSTDTIIQYTVQSGDFDQEGVYEINAYAEFPGPGTGETIELEVFRRYN